MRPVMAIHKLNLTTPASLGGDFQNNKLAVWQSSKFSHPNLFSITLIFTSQVGFVRTPKPPPLPQALATCPSKQSQFPMSLEYMYKYQ